MKKKLTARPNIEHLKGKAKSLLAAIKNQEPEAHVAFADYHPDKSPSDPKLADAQLVTARQNGFTSWAKLVHHVDLLNNLEGTWGLKSLEIGGNSIPGGLLTNSKIVMNGDRFNTLSPEGNYLGEFAINVQLSPMEIDVHFIEGPHAGQFSYGIFELKGDELTICLGLVGASRPTEFSSSGSPMHALEHLRRETKDAPVTVANSQPPEPLAEEGETAGFESVSPEFDALQGEWKPLVVVNSGERLPDDFMAFGKRMCKGNHVLVSFGSPMVDALARIHDGNQIDYLGRTGPMKGKIQLGIYELVDGVATFCMAPPGAPRPTDFTSEPGSGHTLTSWRKA